MMDFAAARDLIEAVMHPGDRPYYRANPHRLPGNRQVHLFRAWDKRRRKGAKRLSDVFAQQLSEARKSGGVVYLPAGQYDVMPNGKIVTRIRSNVHGGA